MLTDAELAAIRTTAGAALPDTAVIQSKTWTSDGGGAGTSTWTASGTVDCRIAPSGIDAGREGESGGRISADAEYIATLPFDANVNNNSRLVIGGTTYNIEAIRVRSWSASTICELRRDFN